MSVRRSTDRATWGIGVLVVIVALGIALSSTMAGRRLLHRIDVEWLGERAMDTLARLRSQEDWSSVAPLNTSQDYAWLKAGGPPVRIAHALGESGGPTANTLDAMRRSYRAGFRIFEVDLVLDQGQLRCQHDFESRTPPVPNDCTFESLLEALPADSVLVLDIKSDFEAAGRHVVERVKRSPAARRIVFQLYRPNDFRLFEEWQREAAFAGPVLTAYLSHRRVNYLAGQMSRLGGLALTLPVERVPALTVRPAGMALLLHPVHDEEACTRALRSGAQGVYLLNTLLCGS